MTPIAIVFFIIAAVLIWGGLLTSIFFLAAKPEVARYPAGDPEPDSGEQDL